MKSFQEIQDILGQLPNYPKIYLLGSTGAGKTSIIRAILDTAGDAFPSTLPTRTTVAPTEYVISSTKPFKSTFIFKEQIDIEIAINEILELTIDKLITQKEEIINLSESLEETADQKFRLKYLLSSDILEKISSYIINTLLPKTNHCKDIEEVLQMQTIQAEINYLVQWIIDEIITFTKKICPHYTLFDNALYTIDNIKNKSEFIKENKKILDSKYPSISPLIEYARIEGKFSDEVLPNRNSEYVLIDGEGIGHDRGEINNSLSTRHLEFFKDADCILLVEKSNDPLNAAGLSAIKTIYINGYSEKFKLIFSKTDLLSTDDAPKDIKEIKKDLNKDLISVKKVLKDSKIDFFLKDNQKFYLSNLDDKPSEESIIEFKRLFRSIKKKDEDIVDDLQYDFDRLFLNLKTTSFLDEWKKKVKYNHWTVIKALTNRVSFGGSGYKHLKPVFDFHMLIMQEVNTFLNADNNTEAIDTIKRHFSEFLMIYIQNNLIINNHSDWINAYKYSGKGSAKRREASVVKIFESVIVKETEVEKFQNFKELIKENLIKAGAKEKCATTKVSLKHIQIEKIYGIRDIEWSLSPNTNILIGKNGSGKSTVLKLIKAYLQQDNKILEKFESPKITITLNKEYENGELDSIIISDNQISKNLNIDIEYIDTFDIISESTSKCKDNCEKDLSLLDSELLDLLKASRNKLTFNDYQIKLKKIFEEKNAYNQKEIQRILNDIGKGIVLEASKVQELTDTQKTITNDVYQPLNNFRDIIDSMFRDTNKKINLELIEETFSISSTEKELEPLDLSSGEKQILIIFLTILLKENKPYILMMDEPENSLHSEWQIHFINNIRKLNENVQLVIATHNPLLMLDRKGDEIGKISIDSDTIDTSGTGTKYLDVSATLLSYPQVSSLVGDGDMKEEINQLFRLKNQDTVSPVDENKIDELEKKLGSTVASNFIYDRHYLRFLRFIQDNKDIDFDKLTEISEDEMDELLGEFKDLFND
ncbi:MAG TPA: ATP-binding cassette domain-containing protein [Arcobacter sp.]|nr:ATP-binding cassette domain-containing protein [Arcobacter sp.]